MLKMIVRLAFGIQKINVGFCKLNLLFAVSGDILAQTEDSVHPLFATHAATKGPLTITFWVFLALFILSYIVLPTLC